MTFSINLNAQHVNGMTHFHLAVHVLLLGTLGFYNSQLAFEQV